MKYESISGLNMKPRRVNAEGTINRVAGLSGKARNVKVCSDDMPIDPSWLDFNIRRRGNHIYFYEEINEVTQMILQVMLRDAVRDVLTEHVGEILGGELSESVVIHLNSPGGYLSCGFALYDYIKTSQVPVTCIVEGFCASAATLILLACSNRAMSPNSSFLMHQCSWGCYGENRLMQDFAANAEKDMKRLRNIYMKETKIYEGHNEKEREAYIQHLLEHDYELDADECEKLGIVTPSEDEDEVELSDERVEKLQNFIKKLAEEQKKDNKKKELEELKETVEGKQPSKKKPSKAPAKKEKPARKTSPKKTNSEEKEESK